MLPEVGGSIAAIAMKFVFAIRAIRNRVANPGFIQTNAVALQGAFLKKQLFRLHT